jgi:signal transduction histidine kinase
LDKLAWYENAFYKNIILIIVLILCILVTIYVNWYMGIDAVYTHLYYIPIILAGLWYYRKAIYVALFLGLVHICIGYVAAGFIVPSTIVRTLMFVVVAIVISYLSSINKKTENELRSAKLQSELYLDLMGHDINNLNQVGMGFIEMALDTSGLDDNGRSLISKSLAAFENSSRLIDNVRKLQKVRSGELHHQEMDVGQVLSDVQHHYSNMHGRNITLSYTSVTGYMVMANELLYDVFSNLVGNAIKHSNGNPVINIELKKVNENNRDYYKIAVEDNGPGIPDNMKAMIFNRHLGGGHNTKGSGIGLYLVKMLVDDYGGKVWIEDRVSGDRAKGSRFVVMLPAIEK